MTDKLGHEIVDNELIVTLRNDGSNIDGLVVGILKGERVYYVDRGVLRNSRLTSCKDVIVIPFNNFDIKMRDYYNDIMKILIREIHGGFI